jgi:hypothetical protein
MLAMPPPCHKRGVEVGLPSLKRVPPRRMSEEESHKKSVFKNVSLTLHNGAFLYTKGSLSFLGFAPFKKIGAFHT